MKGRFARASIILFIVSAVLWVLLTLFESAMVGTSLRAERVITLFALVLFPSIGAALGVFSLVRKEGQRVLSIAGIILNTIFALFHAMIVLFAG